MKTSKYHFYWGAKNLTFVIDDKLSDERAEQIEKTVLSVYEKAPKIILFSFERAKKFPPQLAQCLSRTMKLCSQEKINFSLCNLSPDAKGFLRANDLLGKLKVYDDYFAWAKEALVSDSQRVNFGLSEIFHKSVIEVVPSFLQVSIKDSHSFITRGLPEQGGYIASSMELRGKRLNGNFLIYIQGNFMSAAMSELLGEPVGADSAECIEGVSEIANMIFGNAKTIINAEGFNVQIEIPKILTPEKAKALQVNRAYNFVLSPFRSNLGNLYCAMRF